MLLSIDEALKRVLQQCEPLTPAVCSATEALGLVLAEEIAADVDSPPHDKALVDGYAVRALDVQGGQLELEVIEEVAAGAVPTRTLTAGAATRVMTGAPIPPGADAVIMVEESRLLGVDGQPQRVCLAPARFSARQNILPRAASMARGDVVLRPGITLRAIEMGLLAEVGRTQVRAVPRPRLAVLPTGNELVVPWQTPGAGQIRNSNGAMLVAAAQSAGASPVDLGIARDLRESLREHIARGLESDVLAISGGVSAGLYDLVPTVLDELGVRQVFHKVNLKPGKPLWFGVSVDGPRRTLVFGLPGNPVSSLVCFELFVRPAIARLAGRSATVDEFEARLARDFQQRSDRPTYHPARLSNTPGPVVEPLDWKGSGDLRTLADANALVFFSPGERTFRRGETVSVRLLLPG